MKSDLHVKRKMCKQSLGSRPNWLHYRFLSHSFRFALSASFHQSSISITKFQPSAAI